MNIFRFQCALGVALAAILLAIPALAQTRATLNPLEEDRVREAQEPSERIVVYMDLLDVRLARFDEARRQPVDQKYDQPAFLRELMGEYIALNDELKIWIEDHYERMDDMRGGLKKLIERGPAQLLILRGIQQQEGPLAESYSDSLQDAIDQMADTVDGATVALAEQEKKLKALKKQEKEDVKLAKKRAKEEARRTKREKKERQREGKKRTVPGDIPED